MTAAKSTRSPKTTGAKSTTAKRASKPKKVEPNVPPPAPKGGNAGSKVSAKTVIGAAVAVATAAAAAIVAFRTASGDERKVFHLMPHEKGWQVRKEGKDRAEKTFEKKQEARDYARDLADSSHPSQLVIHRTDGTIQTVHTYGE